MNSSSFVESSANCAIQSWLTGCTLLWVSSLSASLRFYLNQCCLGLSALTPWRLHHKPATSQLTESFLPVLSCSTSLTNNPGRILGGKWHHWQVVRLFLHGLPLLHTLHDCMHFVWHSPKAPNANLHSFSVNRHKRFRVLTSASFWVKPTWNWFCRQSIWIIFVYFKVHFWRLV